MNCCICLETFENFKYDCSTCSDGKICYDCMLAKDPNLSLLHYSREELEDAIKCPCCRQLNWKYHFTDIITITLNEELECGETFKQGFFVYPSHKIFLLNRVGEEEFEERFGKEGDDYQLIKIVPRPICLCSEATDIRGRCDIHSKYFLKCSVCLDTTIWHLENDYQVAMELEKGRSEYPNGDRILKTINEFVKKNIQFSAGHSAFAERAQFLYNVCEEYCHRYNLNDGL